MSRFIPIVESDLSTDDLSSKLSSSPLKSNNADFSDDDSFRVGLACIYASWNSVPSFSQLAPILRNLLRGLSQKYECSILRVEADKTDDHLDQILVQSDLPHPPETLPALAVVLYNKALGLRMIYLETISSAELIQKWKFPNHHRSHHLEPTMIDELHHAVATLSGDCLIQVPTDAHTMSNSSGLSTDGECLRIFVAGDRMSVGKTSTCLGILGALLAKGYHPEELAYIKPATQNENPQLVQLYCEMIGIECVPIGPVVYYRGFTRAFLAGMTQTSEEMLQQVGEAVDKLANGKKVVVIDGVGFPAVGSICGTDNASVARASGYPNPASSLPGDRIPPAVVLIGGSGVGSAVDAFNLNATYFEMANIAVLGGIWNKLALDGFYSLENCKEQITSYFSQNAKQVELGRQCFGFVPIFSSLADAGTTDHVDEFIEVFQKHVDIDALLNAARRSLSLGSHVMGDGNGKRTEQRRAEIISYTGRDTSESGSPPTKRQRRTEKARKPFSRDQIEQSAIQAGAAPSA